MAYSTLEPRAKTHSKTMTQDSVRKAAQSPYRQGCTQQLSTILGRKHWLFWDLTQNKRQGGKTTCKGVYTLGVFLHQSPGQVLGKAIMSKADRGPAPVWKGRGNGLSDSALKVLGEHTGSCSGAFGGRCCPRLGKRVEIKKGFLQEGIFQLRSQDE